MKKDNVITVLRVTFAVALWFTAMFVGGKLIDPLLEGVFPDMVRIILKTMVLPYTVGLVIFFIPVFEVNPQSWTKTLGVLYEI